MNKKLYTLYAVVFSLALLACSDDNVSGSSEDPNAVTAEKNSSSSSLDVEITSSVEPSELLSSSSENRVTSSVTESSSSSHTREVSSSSESFVLCKASGDWSYGGCSITYPSGEGDLWSTGDLKVKTNAYAEGSSRFGKRAGEFFYETDSIEGGKTIVKWFKHYYISEFGNGSLAADIYLDKGELPYDPFIKLGFYVAGFDSNGTAMSADISNWNGICIVYNGTISPSLQLDLGDSINQKIGYALPSVVLSKQNEPQCYEWKQFKQPATDKNHESISGEDAAKHVVRVVLLFQQSKPSEEFEVDGFQILAIGTNRDE